MRITWENGMKRIKRNTARTQQRCADRQAASDMEGQRRCNDVFMFFRHCDNTACRRKRSCAGEPRGCFERHWHRFSKAEKVWLRAGVQARQNGQNVQQAMATANAEVARWRESEARYAQRTVQTPARETAAPTPAPMPRIRML